MLFVQIVVLLLDILLYFTPFKSKLVVFVHVLHKWQSLGGLLWADMIR